MEEDSLTKPGSMPGTPRYMAPEQISGEDVDSRADLYSAALVIFEMITGKLPFSGQKLTELCPEATAHLEQLIRECLSPDRSERPETPIDAYVRLQELGRASGVLLLPPGSMEQLVEARRAHQENPTTAYESEARPIIFWLLLSLLSLLMVGGLWWVLS